MSDTEGANRGSEGGPERPVDASSWKGADLAQMKREGMLDIATDRPLLPAFRSRSARADAIISVFGLIALASPLALWIAWTPELLFWALTAGLGSTGVCWLTVRLADSD